MDAAIWERVVEIFHTTAERPEEEHEALVAEACANDPEMRRMVMEMLEEDRHGSSSLVSRGASELMELVFGEAQAGGEAVPSYLPPERIGLYQRQEFLGRGGMGAVWKYLRADTRQPMAIKFLFVHPLDPLFAAWRERFADEIKTLAKLRHAYIVAFHDAGVLEDGTSWFVMDYVEQYAPGMSFTVYCRQMAKSIEEQLRLFRRVSEAVLYAHLQGIIHRDLKPSNLLLSKDGSPRIVDFGIARQLEDPRELESATRPTLGMMSRDYAAPEWKRDGQVGVCTDVYSLGVMLYEVLAGHHPYRRSGQPSFLIEDEGIYKLPEKPSSVAGKDEAGGVSARLSRSAWSDLDKLCLKAMHPDPRERYASVESLMRDIDHYLSDEPLEAQPRMLRYRAGKFLRRNRQAVTATAAMLVLLTCSAALFTWRLAHERNHALAQAARAEHLQSFMTDLLQGGDQEAGPAANLPVTAMIDRGVQQAGSLGNEPEVQADLYETLGSMSQKLGRLDRAESLLEKALAGRRSMPERDAEGIAMTSIALALVRAEEGKTKEAEEEARRALDAIKSGKTRSRGLIGQAELALGTIMIQAGEHKQAIPVLAEAAGEIEAEEGARSPRLARALRALADANIYMGNYDATDALNDRALSIDRAVYGENHPHVAEDERNLSQTLEMRGRYAQAETLERESLATTLQWYGPDHPETASQMTTLASTLLYEGKVGEANDLLHRALAIQERVYGPESAKAAYVLNSMGSAALKEKRFEEAERDFERIAEIYRHAYSDGDYRVAVALGNLASVYQAEKRYAQAAAILLDVVQRFTRALGAENLQTGMAQARLGRNLLYEEKYAEAEAHSLTGYGILSKQMSPDAAWVTGTRHDLAAAYAAMGEEEKARQFAAK